jgi:hypothetical protein
MYCWRCGERVPWLNCPNCGAGQPGPLVAMDRRAAFLVVLWKAPAQAKIAILSPFVVFTIYLIAMVLISGCGHEQVASLDLTKAKELAMQALPDKSQLPGGGWVLARTGPYAAGSFANVPGCSKPAGVEDRLGPALDTNLVTQDGREFTRQDDAAGDFVTIDYSVYVYKSSSVPAKAVRERKAYIADAGFADCLRQRLKVPIEMMKPSAAPVNGGYALAYDLPAGTRTFRFQIYEWRVGNVLAVARITSVPPSGASRGLVAAALSCLEAHLLEATGAQTPVQGEMCPQLTAHISAHESQ